MQRHLAIVIVYYDFIEEWGYLLKLVNGQKGTVRYYAYFAFRQLFARVLGKARNAGINKRLVVTVQHHPAVIIPISQLIDYGIKQGFAHFLIWPRFIVYVARAESAGVVASVERLDINGQRFFAWN
jgi:hypothetical protein